jgi:TatA/E family protein of Tat protein translocase
MKPFYAFIHNIGWPELLVILGLVLIFFGPRRLPEIAESFGKSIKKFRSATSSAADEVKKELNSATGEKAEDSGRKSPEETEES